MDTTIILLESFVQILILIFIIFCVFAQSYFIFLFLYFASLLIKYFLNYKKKPKKPGPVSLLVISQGENSMLKFVLVLPPKGAEDVVSREVTYTVGSVGPSVLVLSGDANETELLEGNDDEVVVGRLVDVDNAGNRSDAREFKFTLLDTIAPPQPGEVGVRVVAEE